MFRRPQSLIRCVAPLVLTACVAAACVLPAGAHAASGHQTRIDGTIGTLAEKLPVIVSYADAYYRSAFQGYTTPTFYYNGEQSSWTCEGQATNVANNAFYCRSGSGGEHFVTWDTNWLQTLFSASDKGDAAVAAIIAHELGHAWQIPNMTSEKLQQPIWREHFGDCAAGTFLRAMNDSGHLDTLGAGDIDEAWNGIASIGDDLPEDNPNAHGSPELRTEWLRYGWDNGAQACVDAVS